MKIKPEELKTNLLLRELLINYCLLNYEENAELSFDSLAIEYNLLLKNNELNELISAATHTVSMREGFV